MAKLETTYLGLKLKNPIVVGSSGLTNSVEKIKKLRDAGAGAVVLKSLFEEQINHDVNRAIHSGQGLDYPEALDYMKNYSRDNSVAEYLKLIKEAKAAVDIPVIASINCYSDTEWIDFAVQIENAGADAIELNLFVLNTDKNSTADSYEELYYNIAKAVSEELKIPVVMKLGLYFSNLVSVVNKLSVSGAKGVVLFNRFYEPDIDINTLSITAAEVFSSPADIRRSLRWVAIVSDKVKNIEVAASTGIHDGDAVIKQLLAGARVTQVCSSVYKNGPEVITRMVKKLEEWMDEKKFKTIDELRGLMSYKKIQNPVLYERAQFMRYFSKFE
ncbi:dihydroorotate dehydrogenase-like protein [Natronoflexus pectinivorans]|uniref:Dihydroorotate dehydrogenase (Fumarate) n=1 Tax=Natronoflexus pectinivorans TaxID=682526 RepID=A0A4R2GK16_9BACT|nr:dihydroorotate dehydrogenase-like protein [Natronoflexus pectinivorans]TCO09102.1 dihydroorotate dehydrogenase (fumarate) [Natronoflexus pectinivorans]